MGNSTSASSNLKDVIYTLTSAELTVYKEEFFVTLFEKFDSLEDLCDHISVTDIEKMIVSTPNNIEFLLYYIVNECSIIIDAPDMDKFHHILKCIRMLTRIMPTLLRFCKTNDRLCAFLWDDNVVVDVVSEKETQPLEHNQSIDRANDDSNTASINSARVADLYHSKHEQQNGKGFSVPMGALLVNTLFHMLFLPAFTIEESELADDTEIISGPDPNRMHALHLYNIKYSKHDAFSTENIWFPGIGTPTKGFVYITDYDVTRVEVLQCIMATLCDSIYDRPLNDPLPHRYDCPYLKFATSMRIRVDEHKRPIQTEGSHVYVTFCSLLNSVLGYDPVGWGKYGIYVMRLLLETSFVHIYNVLHLNRHPIWFTDCS